MFIYLSKVCEGFASVLLRKASVNSIITFTSIKIFPFENSYFFFLIYIPHERQISKYSGVPGSYEVRRLMELG